ncbi:MAG TPA: hypothetical protein ENH95_05915 [Nitrosopumilus sp.]|nr:hypothetical protein [Nitrosopumilus sp.]
MSTTDMEKLKTEMVVFLRNSDILSITQRGVTTISNVFNATTNQTVFTLSNAVARNIRSVVLASEPHTPDRATKNAYDDYTPDYKSISSTITFGTGISENSSVIVTYDYSSGTTEKVWADYPELQYLPASVPRVGFDITGFRTQALSIGDSNWFSDALITVKVYDSNLKNIDGFISTIRSKVKESQLSFYHFQIVRPKNIGPALLHDITSKSKLSGKVFEKAIDLLARFNFEV